MIEVDKENPYGKWEASRTTPLSGEQILQQIHQMGVVGTGGATFQPCKILQFLKEKALMLGN